MATAAAPPDADGWCSLSLHAGGTSTSCTRAGADPSRLLVVEVSERFPAHASACRRDHPHALHVDEIDLLVESDDGPLALPDAAPTEVDRAIAEHARRFIRDGATLQTGIGAIPSTIADAARRGRRRRLRHPLGDVHRRADAPARGGQGHATARASSTASRSRRSRRDRASSTTGSTDNDEVAFLPVDVVNSPELIARNRAHGHDQRRARDRHPRPGRRRHDRRRRSSRASAAHEDFVSGPGLSLEARSLLCLPSTVTVDGELRSRIVPVVRRRGRHHHAAPPGRRRRSPSTAPRSSQGKTVHQRGEALAAIAHPDFRDELLEAAERASRGRSPRGVARLTVRTASCLQVQD